MSHQPNIQDKVDEVIDRKADEIAKIYGKPFIGIELVKDFVREILSLQGKEIVAKIRAKKLLEVGVNPEALMWKLRFNKSLEDVATSIEPNP